VRTQERFSSDQTSKEIFVTIIRFLAPTLLVFFLSLSPALSQTLLSKEGPSDAAIEVTTPENYVPAMISPGALPDAPNVEKSKVRVFDKKFVAVMAILGGAETLRYTTHKLVLDNEYAAGAPWVTSVPKNSHISAKYAGIFAAEMLVAYELKKPHDWLPGDRFIRKFWWLYPAVMTSIHVKNGVRSIRTTAPAGSECPPEYADMCQ
jgi:hypothetical protein